MYVVSSAGLKDELWMVEPADETERSLPGVGIPVLVRPGVGIPDDRGFWFVDAYMDVTDFASWPAVGTCRSFHASSSTIRRKAAHGRASRPQPVIVRHRKAAHRCGQDNSRGLPSDPPIRFLFLRRKPRSTAPNTIPSGCPASPLGLTRDRIPTVTTRSKTETWFPCAKEECVWPENTRPSSG